MLNERIGGHVAECDDVVLLQYVLRTRSVPPNGELRSAATLDGPLNSPNRVRVPVPRRRNDSSLRLAISHEHRVDAEVLQLRNPLRRLRVGELAERKDDRNCNRYLDSHDVPSWKCFPSTNLRDYLPDAILRQLLCNPNAEHSSAAPSTLSTCPYRKLDPP